MSQRMQIFTGFRRYLEGSDVQAANIFAEFNNTRVYLQAVHCNPLITRVGGGRLFNLYELEATGGVLSRRSTGNHHKRIDDGRKNYQLWHGWFVGYLSICVI